MALVNGAIDSVLLSPAAGTSGARLRFGTANRWAKCRAEVHRRYGWYPEVTSAGDGYRDRATQERIFFQRYSRSDSGWRGAGHIKTYQGLRYYIRTNPITDRPYAVAATPGESNHGFAIAVDVAGLSARVLIRWAQFADVAPEFGFSNAEGASIGEAWHWVDTLNPDDALDGTPPPVAPPSATGPEEDDMYGPEEHLYVSTRLNQAISMIAQVFSALTDPDTGLAKDVALAKDNAYVGASISQKALNAIVDPNAGALARLALLQAAVTGEDVDEAALAAQLAANILPTITTTLVDAIRSAIPADAMTPEKAQAAAEQAVRNVLGTLG